MYINIYILPTVAVMIHLPPFINHLKLTLKVIAKFKLFSGT